MKTLEQLREEIKSLYDGFFAYNEIDPITGIWKNAPEGRNLRFATMPHIGFNYVEAPKKILFVGYDIGNDEVGKLQSFNERDFGCLDLSKLNPHIAGTYLETLYLFAQSDDTYKEMWEYFMNSQSPNKSVIRYSVGKIDLDANMLSNVALTNLHKFVTIGRGKKNDLGKVEGRKGALDRDWFGIRSKIEDLLIGEIKILKPDIIWFQGKNAINQSIWDKMVAVCDWEMSKYHSDHPSYYGKIKANTPQYICSVNGKKVK